MNCHGVTSFHFVFKQFFLLVSHVLDNSALSSFLILCYCSYLLSLWTLTLAHGPSMTTEVQIDDRKIIFAYKKLKIKFNKVKYIC